MYLSQILLIKHINMTGEDRFVHLMKSTSRITLPFPAGICFKYLKSRLTEQGITIVSANELFHQFRVAVRATWLVPRLCFDIKILGKLDKSDVYITHRQVVPFRLRPFDDLITRQINRIASAIEPES